MQPTTNGYSRRALLILAALKSKGFMAAYGSRLLTAEMMQNLTRAEGYLMITAAAEGTDMVKFVATVEAAVNEVIDSIFSA